MRKSEDGFEDILDDLSKEDREEEESKKEEYGDDYMPPQKGW